MKENEIKIRVSNETKNTFKKTCEFKRQTMSSRIIELIMEDVNKYDEIFIYTEKKQFNLLLLRTVINKTLIDVSFDVLTAESLKEKIEQDIKKYLSFDVEVCEIEKKDKWFTGEVLCYNDNNKEKVSLKYCIGYGNENL